MYCLSSILLLRYFHVLSRFVLLFNLFCSSGSGFGWKPVPRSVLSKVGEVGVGGNWVLPGGDSWHFSSVQCLGLPVDPCWGKPLLILITAQIKGKIMRRLHKNESHFTSGSCPLISSPVQPWLCCVPSAFLGICSETGGFSESWAGSGEWQGEELGTSLGWHRCWKNACGTEASVLRLLNLGWKHFSFIGQWVKNTF